MLHLPYDYNNRNLQLFDYLKDKDRVSFLLDSIEAKFGTQFSFLGKNPNFEYKESADNISYRTLLYLHKDSLVQTILLVQTEDKSQFKTMTKLYECTESFCKQFEIYNDSLTEGYTVNGDFIQLMPLSSDNDLIGFGISVQRFLPDVWKKEREKQEQIEKEINESDNSLAKNLGLIH